MASRNRIHDFDAHSPMFKNRHFDQEKRSRLFDDRPFIYGRMPKLLLAWMFASCMWSGFYIYHKHTNAQHLQMRTRKCYRRVVPFVQAVEDIKFVALQERNYMILKAMCDYHDSKLFEFFRTRYSQNDIYVDAVRGVSGRHGYDGRFGIGRYWNVKSYRRPEDEDGLVSFQQQSHY